MVIDFKMFFFFSINEAHQFDTLIINLDLKRQIQNMMGKFSSKLGKNKNNADISLWQIYLPKLHKNTLKY